MTAIAAILFLHATAGFYGDTRGSWELSPYPSMTACESDRPRQAMRAEGRGLHGITTKCLVTGKE